MTRELAGTGEPPPPRSRELEAAIAAARAAGGVVLAALGDPGFEVKDDASILTEADGASERILRERLSAAFPGARIVGEESARDEDVRALVDGDAWVLDPIDGTAAYSVALPTFAVSVGLLRDGEPVAGAILLPRTGELYAADLAGPAWWGTSAVRTTSPEAVDARTFLCVPSNVHHSWRVLFPGKARCLGSTALHVALVARGAAVGALLEPAIWDVAAVVAILRRAGGDLFELDGAPLDVRAWVRAGAPRRFLLACAPGAVDVLRSTLVRW